MPNFDGVHETRWKYSVPISGRTIIHTMTLDVKVLGTPVPGTDFTAIQTVAQNGTNATLQAEVQALWDIIRTAYNTAVELVYVELWRYGPNGQNAIYISASDVTNPLGTSAVVPMAAQQQTFTFRSTNGGIMRLQLMETSVGDNLRQTPPYTPAGFQSLSVYVTGNSRPWQARDDGYPFVAIACSGGQNEALFRKRFRS